MKLDVRKMSRRRSRLAQLPQDPKSCRFCGISEENEVEFGKLWNHNGIVTHYFCLLLSSNMEQNGNDNEGILGFMPTDIQKELRRGKRLSCTYCKRAGATLGCCNSRCKRVFHLPCGLQAGSLHQFFGEFRSFCITHRINQKIDEHIKVEAAAAGTVTCYICYEEVNPQNSIRTLWAPCCRKNAWFHRKCVQRLALSAGYFFKCPLCNNKQEFQKAMLEHGIFIPNQDASWELVPDAFQELLYRHSRCDAVECLCPKGRSHTSVNAKWELVLCRLCGSQGIHIACGHLKLASSIWECAECVGMLKTTSKTAPCTNQLTEASNKISEHESSSDSEISVGQNPSPLPMTERPDSPPPNILPIKLRPGPRSFKLQQAVQNAKSAELMKTNTINKSTRNPDLRLSSSSYTKPDVISDEKFNGEASQAERSSADKNSLAIMSTPLETNSTISEESNAVLAKANAKLTGPTHHVAEVIVIDSDDEIEIIAVESKQNILTTNNGIKIPIHSLSQVNADPQRAEGDVKVVESKDQELSELLPCQSKDSFVINCSIALDSSGSSNTHSPISVTSVTSQLYPSNVPQSPVSSRKGSSIAPRKALENTEVPDLVVTSKVPQKNSVMNLKITNVTSLRREDFRNTFEEPMIIRRIDVTKKVRAGSVNPVNGTPKSGATVFPLSTAAITDLNVKRRSEEYIDKNLPNSPNNEVMENHKRLRVYEPINSGSIQKNTSILWNINVNDVNEPIPVLATSMPLTYSSNSNTFQQSTAMFQAVSNKLQTDTHGGVRTINDLDIQKKNGFHKYPPGTELLNSVQNKNNNNANHVNGPNNQPFPIGALKNSLHVSTVPKTYSSVWPQKDNQLSVKNMQPNNVNTHGTTQSSQQIPVNGPQNLPKISSRSFTPQTLTQQIRNSRKNAALNSHSINQSHEHVNRDIQRHSESSRTLQPNPSMSDVSLYNGLPNNSLETPTGTNGNQPNVDDMPKTNLAITQLANGIPISRGCDGDAGSSPAAEAGFADQTTSRSPVHAATEPITFIGTDATSNTTQSTDDNSSISACVSAIPTNVQCYSSLTKTRRYCDTPRIIPQKVPLRNLKFRVLDSKTVQIVAYDTFTLNTNSDTGNLQNTGDAEGIRSSIKKQEPLFRQKSNSSLSKFGSIGNCHDINTNQKHGSPKTHDCSNIANTAIECTSLTRSLQNPLVPTLKFDSSELSNNAATAPDGKAKASCVLETKCNIGDKISNVNLNPASLADNESHHRIRKMDSITEKSTINQSFSASSGGNNRQSCIRQKENLSKEDMICPSFSNNSRNLKNLCERDDNIISINKLKGFSENVSEISVKTVKHKKCVRTKDENKRSMGLNTVPKCLVRNLDDSSKLNLSVDRYNFRKIVDRSFEFNCNNKDSDADIQDSFKNNASDFAGLGTENERNIVSVNSNSAKSEKCFDTMNSVESKDQAVNMNMFNSSCTLLSSDSSLRRPTITALKDQINSIIDINTSRTCESGLAIKVKIDLDKIQHFIDSKPQLFDKRNCTKSKRADECGTKTLPNLVASKNLYNTGSKKRLYFSERQTIENEQETKSLHTRKRFKSNSVLFKEHSNR